VLLFTISIVIFVLSFCFLYRLYFLKRKKYTRPPYSNIFIFVSLGIIGAVIGSCVGYFIFGAWGILFWEVGVSGRYVNFEFSLLFSLLSLILWALFSAGLSLFMASLDAMRSKNLKKEEDIIFFV